MTANLLICSRRQEILRHVSSILLSENGLPETVQEDAWILLEELEY